MWVAILLTLLHRCSHHLLVSTVLVVDDDPSNRYVIRMILEPAGYEILEAGDGEAALNLLGPNRLPDVITTDLTMPNLTGEGLIERLRSEPRTASIPIVVVSGNYDAAHALHATGLVEAVVDKPIEHTALAECIRTLTTTAIGSAMIRASREFVQGKRLTLGPSFLCVVWALSHSTTAVTRAQPPAQPRVSHGRRVLPPYNGRSTRSGQSGAARR